MESHVILETKMGDNPTLKDMQSVFLSDANLFQTILKAQEALEDRAKNMQLSRFEIMKYRKGCFKASDYTGCEVLATIKPKIIATISN